MLCNHCGMEMPNDSRYCRMCGEPLIGQAVYPPPPADPRPVVRQQSPDPDQPTSSRLAQAVRSPGVVGEMDLPPAPQQRRGEWRKRRRHRKWHQKLLANLDGTLSDVLKVLGVVVTVVVLYLLLRLAR